MSAAGPADSQKLWQAGWWDANGPHALLHTLNPVRLAYVKDAAGLEGRKVADIGCGGGILTEAMAAAGASVVGVDSSPEAIACARRHAEAAALTIDYVAADCLAYARDHAGQFDVVTCMEMLEHVEDQAGTIAALASMLRPNGSLLLSTINRTPLAWASVIVALERVLGSLPPGTHDYRSFVKPEEALAWCEAAGLRVRDVAGVNWSFFGKTFLLSRTAMPANYILHAKKD